MAMNGPEWSSTGGVGPGGAGRTASFHGGNYISMLHILSREKKRLGPGPSDHGLNAVGCEAAGANFHCRVAVHVAVPKTVPRGLASVVETLPEALDPFGKGAVNVPSPAPLHTLPSAGEPLRLKVTLVPDILPFVMLIGKGTPSESVPCKPEPVKFPAPSTVHVAVWSSEVIDHVPAPPPPVAFVKLAVTD